MGEALLIVEPALADQVLGGVTRAVTVTQRLPPRLAVVTGDEDDLAALQQVPGVVAVIEGSVPESARAELDPTERLFVDAWLKRQQPKVRPGEGLPWDAPGYLPPDPPGWMTTREEEGQND